MFNRTIFLSIGAVGLILILGITAVFLFNRQPAAAITGHLLAEVTLSDGPYNATTIAEFELTETAVTHLRFTLTNLDTAVFALQLQPENDASITILHAEDYRTNQDGGGDWEQTLPAGHYRLVLTAEQSPGTVKIYQER